MAETFTASKTGFERLRKALSNADEDTRWSFGFWCAGLALMALAIVLQFGWIGTLFNCGLVVYAAGQHGLTHRKDNAHDN